MVAVVVLKNSPIRVTVYALIDKMEDLGLWPTVQLSFDFLWVGVLSQLLPGVINEKKKAVVVRVVHFELLGTEPTHVLCRNIWSHQQGFPCAAAAYFLECNSKIVLWIEETCGKNKNSQPRPNKDNSLLTPKHHTLSTAI